MGKPHTKQDRAWEHMAQLLDKEMPKKRNRYSILIWVFGTTFITLIISFFIKNQNLIHNSNANKLYKQETFKDIIFQKKHLKNVYTSEAEIIEMSDDPNNEHSKNKSLINSEPKLMKNETSKIIKNSFQSEFIINKMDDQNIKKQSSNNAKSITFNDISQVDKVKTLEIQNSKKSFPNINFLQARNYKISSILSFNPMTLRLDSVKNLQLFPILNIGLYTQEINLFKGYQAGIYTEFHINQKQSFYGAFGGVYRKYSPEKIDASQLVDSLIQSSLTGLSVELMYQYNFTNKIKAFIGPRFVFGNITSKSKTINNIIIPENQNDQNTGTTTSIVEIDPLTPKSISESYSNTYGIIGLSYLIIPRLNLSIHMQSKPLLNGDVKNANPITWGFGARYRISK